MEKLSSDRLTSLVLLASAIAALALLAWICVDLLGVTL